MNKKIALSTVLIAIIALALSTWFVHNQISDLQNRISELQAQNDELQDQTSELQEKNSNLQKQIDDLQNRLLELQKTIDIASDVKIIDANWIGGFNPIVGVTLAHPVNVTVQNTGVNDVSGLNLTVKLLYKDTQTEVGRGFAKQIDMIHAGEILEFSGYILATIDSFSADSAVCVVTLTLGDFVLDEWTITLVTKY
jgi:uncharacterized protein YlxW (UPF0749 family)